MCSNDNVTQVLPWVTEESKWNAIMEELQRMKNSVNQNQISHSLIIYCMLQLTLLLKGAAEGRWLGARCYSTWLRNISPFVIKTLRVSHSPCPRRGWTPSPLWDKGALVFSCNMENNHNFLWDVTIRWFYLATSEPTQKSDCFIWPPIHGRQCVQLFPLGVLLSCEQKEWSLVPPKASPTSSASNSPLHIPWHTGQGSWNPAAPKPPWAAAWARSAGGPGAVPKERWQVRTQRDTLLIKAPKWTEDGDQLPWDGGSIKRRKIILGNWAHFWLWLLLFKMMQIIFSLKNPFLHM